jgi:hypothetical protein
MSPMRVIIAVVGFLVLLFLAVWEMSYIGGESMRAALYIATLGLLALATSVSAECVRGEGAEGEVG